MPTVVIPYRGSDPKRRLEPMAEADRKLLAKAMLEDVVAAAQAGLATRLLVVSPDLTALPRGVEHVSDPHHGQGAAVRAALDAAVGTGAPAPFLVLNADLPCVSARDVLALAGAIPAGGLALARASDGTTNALGLSSEHLFEPLYGPGSADRYAALAPSRVIDAPNLVDDVDTLADLTRLTPRLGPSTRRLLSALGIGAAA